MPLIDSELLLVIHRE